MLADIFTKGLPAEQFAILCELLMGWTSAREGVSQDKPMSSGFIAYMSGYVQKYMERYSGTSATSPTSQPLPEDITVK